MKKTILITGANSELAYGCIKFFIKKNNLILISSNTKNLKKKIGYNDKNCLIIKTKNYEFDPIIKVLIKNKVEIDSIIHFNGMQFFNSVNNVERDIFEKIFRANCYSFLETLKISKFPTISKKLNSIVTISSVASLKTNKGISLYSASKSALNNMVKFAALEMSKKNIRVNCIILGHINKGMGGKVSKFLNDKQISLLRAQHPLGFGSDKDLLNAIIFLLDKNKSRWITGTNFIVDGGYLI